MVRQQGGAPGFLCGKNHSLPGWGTVIPAEELKGVTCLFLKEEPGLCPKAVLLFFDCSSFVSAFPPFLDEQLIESALWNSGKVKEAG